MAVKYFAYGSNMADAVMAEKCPGYRFLGVARLPDHRLMFNRRSVRTGTGVADVAPSDGAEVWGALYEIDDACLASLDRKEGNDWAYTREALPVELASDGKRQRAVTYIVRDKEPVEVVPSTAYLDGIVSAAKERGLPARYIDSLRERRDQLVANPNGRTRV
jgi:gamma-glutamylcyclotransferase (GGCT)/AIG2-like uncharacterized protein YtfP